MKTRSLYYMLRGKEVVPASGPEEWGLWFDKVGRDRQVAVTVINSTRISTVFVGLDMNVTTQGPPLVFETQCFGGEHDGVQIRAATYDEAVLQHGLVCDIVRGGRLH